MKRIDLNLHHCFVSFYDVSGNAWHQNKRISAALDACLYVHFKVLQVVYTQKHHVVR